MALKRVLIIVFVLLFTVSVFAGSQQTSSTLASAIITTARYYLNEATASFWADAELLVWLNLGTRDIVARTKCLESSKSITLVPNTVEYSVVSITDAGLAIGTTKPRVSSVAFTYIINGVTRYKAAIVAGTIPGDDVIPEDLYGVVAFDIGVNGTIDAIEASDNATGYSSVALAVIDLPVVAAGHIRIGYVSAMKDNGAFTFATTDLDADNTTVTYVGSDIGSYIDLETVIYNNVNGVEKGLIRKNPQSIGHMPKIGEPAYWYEWDGKVGIYPAPSTITDPGLAIGTTKPRVSNVAFTYSVIDVTTGIATWYSKAAVAAGTVAGDDTIPEDLYGVVAFDIGADGTIDAIEASNNVTGYNTVALAAADLPEVEDGHIRMGYVSAIGTEDPFIFGTDDLDAANTTVTYVDATIPTLTVYFVSTPDTVISSAAVKVPVIYDRALILYVAAQALLKQGSYAKSGRLMAEYYAELDRYRQDYVDRPQEPESNIKRVP